ncbi:MAG TPA: NAD-dependent epimerase/dehydratase [Candidatus Koribacter sp.]|jgi:nucleoside-diphosphate-sugar epimerase
MLGNTRFNATLQILVRVLADVLTLNFSLFVGFAIRAALPKISGSFWDLIVRPTARCSWMLTVIGICVFFGMGFYTKGRAYSSRYKVLYVLQASILAFLAFGFVSYFVPFVMKVPRSVLLSSWEIATTILIAGRLWATIWRWVIASETPAPRPIGLKNGKHILLIGGAGYVGSALLPKLLDGGYRVRLLDAFLYGTDPIAEWQFHPNLEILEADFRQVDVLVRAMKNIDSVIHLGAIVGDPACALDEELTIEINLLATRMIAEVAKGHGINRFLFASTCSVYGACDHLLNERSMLNPVSLYARSKIACENVLLELQDDDFAPVILRFGTIYGLSGRTRFDLVVNLLTAKAIVNGAITVYGSDQWRPFLHVDDAALAVFKALEAPFQAIKDTIFNVGSDAQNYTLGDVGRLIKKMVPDADLQFFEENVDRRNYRVSFDRIHRNMGFSPEWTLQSGVQQVITALQSGEVVDFNDPRYSNVRFLSEEIGTEKLRRGDQSWVWQALQKSTGQAVGTRV